MKYMGSKRAMLKNGLGELLKSEMGSASRFLDLFSGSGAVATHVAQNFEVPVHAYDLQQYSTVLARAVVTRRKPIVVDKVWAAWLERAKERARTIRPRTVHKVTRRDVVRLRKWCERQKKWPITRSYGGHYFSAHQAVMIDALRATLPRRTPARIVALAALIQAASRCAAAPGHTAQPFQPTRTAKRFLAEAWKRDVVGYTKVALFELAKASARRKGKAEVKDANAVARVLRSGDLVFLDPPYSGVHYSRFYHVLETIARGKVGRVSGVGRYPSPTARPRSRYSAKGTAHEAIDDLLRDIAESGAKAILTFPNHECSNGLSGRSVSQKARKYFSVERKVVESRFSTLGGTKHGGEDDGGRAARHNAKELVLLLAPRPLSS